jgi:predicted dehydrogenase
MIKCVVVGLGIGTQHAEAIIDMPCCNLTHIVELDELKAKQFIENHNLLDTKIVTFENLLKNNNYDFASVASFDDHHYSQVQELISNNKHVFVEKPLCQTKEQLQSLTNIWKGKRNIGLASNLLLRKAPLYIWLKNMLLDGSLGEIYAFDGDYLYGRINKIVNGWRKDVPNYSVMQGGGIHILDLMLWLTDQKPVTVFSDSNKIVTANSSFKYHDFHSALFNFESGLVARITANFGCVHKHQHAIRIFGTKGTFIHDDMGARVHWTRNEASPPEYIELAPKPTHKGVLLREFLEDIDNQTHNCYAQREFDLMSVVLAADESLSKKIKLKIEYT